MANIPAKKTPKLSTETVKSRKKARVTHRTRITKKARLINFLSKDRGTDIGSLSKRLGWLPHTTRAALSKLRKSGYVITSAKPGKSKLIRYRITKLPEEQGA